MDVSHQPGSNHIDSFRAADAAGYKSVAASGSICWFEFAFVTPFRGSGAVEPWFHAGSVQNRMWDFHFSISPLNYAFRILVIKT